MRLLVLDGTGLGVPDRAIASVEAVESSSDEQPWLPGLIGRSLEPGSSRRALCLHDGGRVEVPGEMRIVDGVEVLPLPDLLQQIGASVGIIGLAELADELLLVCDPNLLAGFGGPVR